MWQFDPADLHLVCSPMYHTVSIRFSTNTLLAGGSLVILSRFDAATALDVLRRHRPNTAFLVPTHLQRILRRPGPRCRRAVRLAAPPRPRRRALSRVGQAGHHGAGRSRHGVGVLRLDRGAVQRLLARRMARAPGERGAGPAGSPLSIEPVADDEHAGDSGDGAGPSGPTCPTSPASATGATPRPPRGAWRGAACTVGDLAASRRRLPLSHGPPPRPHHQRGRQRVPGRDRERAGRGCRDRRGGGVRAARRTVGPARLRGLRGESGPRAWRGGPAGRRVGPPRPVQAAQDVRRRPGSAPHRHRQARCAGPCPSTSGWR